jgi:photosystem II stability/assembly factor-like uncharacterized protein
MIFISYRRADTQQASGRIRERLAEQYGAENIFLDEITRALARTDVFLVLIGPRWADSQNRPRLFDPADVVRLEIETALARGVTTVPIIIDRAPFPTADQVPESLHPLLALNAASIESGVDFNRSVERLIQRIDAVSAAAAERREVVALREDAWQLLNQPAVEAVNALARVRSDPDRIYASALIARRIVRSAADGARWISYATLPAGKSAECLAVSGSRRSGILWVGTPGHLFQYHEADFQWRDTEYFGSLGEREVRWIAASPADPANILVGTGQYSSGTSAGAATLAASGGGRLDVLDEANWKDDVGHGDLHATRNGGASWRTGPFRNVNRVLFGETNPRFIYVATADDGLFISTNDRASFSRSPKIGEYTLWSAAVSPHDAMRVVLGTQSSGALLSFDAGQTWARPAEIGNASVLCAAFSLDDPAILIVGTDAGVFLSKDGGRTFTLSNRGLVHKRILAALPLEGDGFVIGTDGGGVYARTSSGHDWRQIHRGLKRSGIGALVFDADDAMYVGAGGTLCRTEDFGRSFQPLHHVLETIRAICVFGTSDTQGGGGPVVRWSRHEICLIGTEHGEIHRSGDYGQTWERVLERGGGSVRKIARSTARPGPLCAVVEGRTLYVSEDAGRRWVTLGVSHFVPVTFALPEDPPGSILMGTYEDGVMASDDVGATWRAVGTGLPSKPIISLHVSSIAGTRRLLAGLQKGGIWQFSDGWNAWIPSGGQIADESVNDICVRGEHILIATDTGVFRSADGGASWASYSDGLSNVQQVNRLALSSDGRTVFCGEVGGLYGRLVA